MLKKTDKKGIVPLIDTAANGSDPCLNILLLKGADVNRGDESGRTALMLATARGHEKCTIHLISAGADVNNIDRKGVTVSTYAAKSGNQEILIILSSKSSLDKLDRSSDKIPIGKTVFGSTKCRSAIE